MVAAAVAAALACPGQPALVETQRGRELRTAVLACDGDRRVAWIERRFDGRDVTAEIRVRLIAGGRTRVITHGAVSRLRLDDGRTLRWWDWERETWRFRELVPWRGPGCPARSHFRAVVETPEIVALEGDYGFEEDPVDIVRGCVRATGADPVIARAFQSLGNGATLAVVGADRGWVVLVRVYSNRYYGCDSTVVEVVAPASLSHGRNAVIALCDPERLPARGAPLVVSEHGAPAWIVRDATASRVVTAAGSGTIELDSGAPDAITGLAADGGTLRWLHDGEPRSVVLD